MPTRLHSNDRNVRRTYFYPNLVSPRLPKLRQRALKGLMVKLCKSGAASS